MTDSDKPLRRHTKRRVKEILSRPYARILIPDDDGTYTAEILEFPGCYGEGDTAADAIEDLELAAESWIEAAIHQGQQIPVPLDSCGYSGKINLRLPKSLHRQAARFAERDDISLNQFFASAIAARVGAEAFCEDLLRRIPTSQTLHVTINSNVPPSSNTGVMSLWDVPVTPLQSTPVEGVFPLEPPSQDPIKALSNGR